MAYSKILLWMVVAAFLLAGCATTEERDARKEYEDLCVALSKESKGYVTKDEFISGAQSKEEAARLFDLCDHTRDEQLSFEEYLRRRRLIINMFQLVPPPPTVKP